MCGRRVGHVPQRPLHRARHQGAQRLRLGFFPDRAGFPDQGRCSLGDAGVSGRTDQCRRQGVGSHRAYRPALALMAAENAAGDRRRPGRPACRADRRAARPRCSRARSSRHPEKREMVRGSAAPIMSANSANSASLQARRLDGMQRRAERGARRHSAARPQRHRLPCRRLRARSRLRVDVGALNRTMVLDNDTVFGTVNANRMHYEWRGRSACGRPTKPGSIALITRRVPVEQWTRSLAAAARRHQSHRRFLLNQ